VTAPASIEEFLDLSVEPPVRGFLHLPVQPRGDSLLLTHGAGANCQSRLLVSLATEFAQAGLMVLRCDLPFRQTRSFGPPFPASAGRDREGIRQALDLLKRKTAGHVFVGGHSYGGRQASMLIAEQPDLVDGLLLLSYPLHPPRKPEQLRTAHFPKLARPALFVHGSRDPFASFEEMHLALGLIPARHQLLEVEGAGHELLKKKSSNGLPGRIVQAFQEFCGIL
jgi:uncharacterized protein